mgnify:CR=1 FL=1
MELERARVYDLLQSLNGKFFTVVFTKRSTGEVRKMRATTNYAKHLKGGTLNYDAKQKSLIPVWDLDKKAFRSIPTDSVTEIHANGNQYQVI